MTLFPLPPPSPYPLIVLAFLKCFVRIQLHSNFFSFLLHFFFSSIFISIFILFADHFLVSSRYVMHQWDFGNILSCYIYKLDIRGKHTQRKTILQKRVLFPNVQLVHLLLVFWDFNTASTCAPITWLRGLQHTCLVISKAFPCGFSKECKAKHRHKLTDAPSLIRKFTPMTHLHSTALCAWNTASPCALRLTPHTT